MNVNQEVMDQMMADFAAMGGEMFVMDDGWFGDKYPRNNGTSMLKSGPPELPWSARRNSPRASRG